MYEFLWYLQTTSPDKASALLQHLRKTHGEDMGAIFAQFHDDHDGADESATEPNVIMSDAPEATSVPSKPNFRDIVSSEPPKSLLAPNPHSQAKVQELDSQFDMFFNCVGILFYVLDREVVRDNIKAVVAAGGDKMPLAQFLGPETSLEMKTLASELAGMAAMGIVHSQLAFPDTAPPVGLADYLYTVAKHGLDFAIMYDPLRAMKLCALLTLYNIISNATVALAYTGKTIRITSSSSFADQHQELGLSLARNHGFKHDVRPEGWSVSEYEDVRRSHRTLIHMHWYVMHTCSILL